MLRLSLLSLPESELLPDQLFYGFAGRRVMFKACHTKGKPEGIIQIQIYSGHVRHPLQCVIA
jgi:hypothetical protein